MGRRALAAPLLLPLWLALPACVPQYPADQCQADLDCLDAAYCAAGRCRRECAADADCPRVGSECSAGLCTPLPCRLHRDCPAPASCRAGSCRADCASDQACQREGTACRGGVCDWAPCATGGACPQRHLCQAGRCLPWCVSSASCPPGLGCRAVNGWAVVCACEADPPGGTTGCREGERCVEGQCVQPCALAVGDERGSCGGVDWLVCDEAAARCLAPQCSGGGCPVSSAPTGDPVCLMAGEQSGARPATEGRCVWPCTLGDTGDGDDCGVGFRCLPVHGQDREPVCVQVGDRLVGDLCPGQPERVVYDARCSSGLCARGRCSVFCGRWEDPDICGRLMGAEAACRQLTELGVWVCVPAEPGVEPTE